MRSTLLGIIGVLLAMNAQAFELVKLDTLALDYRNYTMVNPNGHEAMTYPNPPKEAINLEMNLDVVYAFYFDSVVESMTTDSQFRDIGLQLRLGVRITDYLEIGLLHHSQHQLDRDQQLPMGHFPESDSVQIKLYIFRANPSGRGSLF